MVKFIFYRLDSAWVLSIVDENGHELHKILYQDINTEDITNLAITLAKGDVAQVNVNYTK